MLELTDYRQGVGAFLAAMEREFYLHFSGLQDGYDIEPIYERHAHLFTREAVDGLRDGAPRSLLEFGAQGYIGRETKAEAGELARREAALEVEVHGQRIPYRACAVVQANEPDADRRAAIEDASNEATTEALDPLLRELMERSHALAVDLGWPSMLAMCEELSGIEMAPLLAQAQGFLADTADAYPALLGPPLREQLGLAPGEMRSGDVLAFFRAPALDDRFPANRLLPVLSETLAGMGIHLESQDGVTVDTVDRPKKSPRAFCSPAGVPDEVYLVIARVGGREDFAALLHEAGHTEHYAHVDASLPAEHRYCGDDSVTEAFAFLFEHLLEDPEWLHRRLGIEDVEPVVNHSRAMWLVSIRRYCSKLGYELELHSGERPLDGLSSRYAQRLSEGLSMEWTRANWLLDVDPFLYTARYLRAWALETHLRRELHERFGPAWFEDPGAGEFLLDLWRPGQRLCADELLAELNGSVLDLSVVTEDVTAS